MEKKEKKDSKEIKDLVKKAEETASKGKEETTKEKPEAKDLKTETSLKKEPKPEPKPEKDPEKEALKDQVKVLTERVGNVENLLKQAAEAARGMQTQGQPQEGLTDEQQLEMLQKTAGPEAVLKQLEFWTNIITKIQSNFISGLKLLPEPVRKETFKRIAAPPEERGEGIEE